MTIVHLGNPETLHGFGALDLEVIMVDEYKFKVRTVTRKRAMTVTGSGPRGYRCSANEYYDERRPCVHIQAVKKFCEGI